MDFLPAEILPARRGSQLPVPPQAARLSRRGLSRGQAPLPGILNPTRRSHPLRGLAEPTAPKVGGLRQTSLWGTKQVLKYLPRYTHRVAISNGRLVSLADDRVSFRWRDSKDGHRIKVMTLEAVEFIRRFLLHILPSGFVKIRHFGFLANRNRAAALLLCREHLKAGTPTLPVAVLSPKQRQRAVAVRPRS